VLEVVPEVVPEVVLEVVLVVLDVTVLDVVDPRQEQPVSSGLMFCA
jgi:hypothetical protein